MDKKLLNMIQLDVKSNKQCFSYYLGVILKNVNEYDDNKQQLSKKMLQQFFLLHNAHKPNHLNIINYTLITFYETLLSDI